MMQFYAIYKLSMYVAQITNSSVIFFLMVYNEINDEFKDTFILISKLKNSKRNLQVVIKVPVKSANRPKIFIRTIFIIMFTLLIRDQYIIETVENKRCDMGLRLKFLMLLLSSYVTI